MNKFVPVFFTLLLCLPGLGHRYSIGQEWKNCSMP